MKWPDNLPWSITQRQFVPTNELLDNRESGKVKFEYVGPVDSDAAQEAEVTVRRRKNLEEKLSQVEENLVDVKRGLRGRRC